MPYSTHAASRADQQLGWLLKELIEKTPGAQQAVLASRDGLKLAWEGLDETAADQMAAALSGLRGLSVPLAGVDEDMQQVSVQFGSVYVFVMRTSDRGPNQVSEILAVRAVPDADARVIGHRMATLIQSVEHHLTTAVRDRAAQ